MNIASRLVGMAERIPDVLAIAEPVSGYDSEGLRNYRKLSFAELNADTDRIAAGLLDAGIRPGMKLAVFVPYGIDFISLVFGLCKAGVCLILIDPGMGIGRMLRCLEEVEPDGFVAVPIVQAIRLLSWRRFPKAKFNLVVPRGFSLVSRLLGRLSLADIRKRPRSFDFNFVDTMPEDKAAIIFTSGSTGPAKGVAFTHRIFDTQVAEISERYGIRPGEKDLACFPFFGLFDAAMGVTTIIPDMNTSRPAEVDPAKIVEAANRWQVTQSFGSPALWNRVADYCLATGKRMDTLRRAVSAGAPVGALLLDRLQYCIHPDGDIFTPYGATEALPTASISAKEVLNETASKTEQGAGVCVGKRFPMIDWKVIEITDCPIPRLEHVRELSIGEIGELAVTGSQVTTQYVNRPEANAMAKMIDSEGRVWHRMGDVGYLDGQDRFWFCGRKAHRVRTPEQTYFSIPCEGIFNTHPKVFRSALASGPRIFIEPFPADYPKTKIEERRFIEELLEIGGKNPITKSIREFRFIRHFPVDVRHNVKIDREKLSAMPY